MSFSPPLSVLNRQWARRPADERYPDIATLARAAAAVRARSAVVSSRPSDIVVEPLDGELMLRVGERGLAAAPTHTGFAHLARLAGAPASYLRTLPLDLVADNLRHGLASVATEDDRERSLLMTLGEGAGVFDLRAITSAGYARVWNAEVAAFGARVSETLGWGAPTAFRRAVDVGTEREVKSGEGEVLSPYYMSDHDILFALVDERRPYDVGDGTVLFRMLVVGANEVGEGSIWGMAGFYDWICSNHNIWGAKGVVNFRVRHVGPAEQRFAEAQGQVTELAVDVPESRVRRMVEAARAFSFGTGGVLRVVEDAEVVAEVVKVKGLDSLVRRQDVSDAIAVARETPRYGDPHSAWGIAQGLTQLATSRPFGDERVRMDGAAGRLLALAAEAA